ncbi:hypothetical protein BAMBUS_05290 [Brevundimonas phage vB_BpoS-Bambus]|nr:hypothetical protein BAMBUS_05290 [Brevundimonas phage vB_BpoS-Bambus]
MTDSLLSAAASARCISLENQIASMEEQMARLVIRLKYYRDELATQASIAGHHARRQKRVDLETPDA